MAPAPVRAQDESELPTKIQNPVAISVPRVNERALDDELFAALDEDVIDAYSAMRNGYLRLREHRVNE